MDQGSSLLLAIDGLVVDQVLIDETGRRVVHCSTDPKLAGWAPHPSDTPPHGSALAYICLNTRHEPQGTRAAAAPQ